MAGKKQAGKPAAKRGRPPVEIKKKPFQVMLDPRYIEYFRNVAREKGIEPQDLARMALNAFVPDPNNPLAGGAQSIKRLFGK